MSRYQVRAVHFDDGEVTIQFTDFPADIRVKGQVVVLKQAVIDLRHRDYAEDASLLEAQVQRLLRNAMDDFDDSEPYEPPREPVPGDDDDDEGLGMGHGDRS